MTSAQTPSSVAAKPRGKPLDQVFNWVPAILFSIVLPYVTYGQLTDRHIMGAVPALLLSGVWPAAESLVTLAIRRKVDELGVLVLVMLAASVVSMLAFNSPSMVLMKDSGITGLFGLAVLFSLLLPRPLMFYFGRKFATNGTKAAAEYWNGLWQYPGFRHTQRVLTVVWGVAFLAEALLRIAIVAAHVLSIKNAMLMSNVLPFVVIALLITFTMVYSARSQRRSAGARTAMAELQRLGQQTDRAADRPAV